MESLLALAAAFLFWRIAMAVAIALVVAVLLAHQVSWFSGGHGVAVVLFAVGAGLLWESSARSSGCPRAPEVKLSAPVATLGLALFGAITGGWASAAARSVAAGAISLVVAAWAVGVYTSRVKKRPFAWRSFLHAVLSLLVGLGCVAWLGALSA